MRCPVWLLAKATSVSRIRWEYRYSVAYMFQCRVCPEGPCDELVQACKWAESVTESRQPTNDCPAMVGKGVGAGSWGSYGRMDRVGLWILMWAVNWM